MNIELSAWYRFQLILSKWSTWSPLWLTKFTRGCKSIGFQWCTLKLSPSKQIVMDWRLCNPLQSLSPSLPITTMEYFGQVLVILWLIYMGCSPLGPNSNIITLKKRNNNLKANPKAKTHKRSLRWSNDNVLLKILYILCSTFIIYLKIFFYSKGILIICSQ